MGCERESPLEGLSDLLLAMRAVLEGHGPVGATLPMRAAALMSAADPLVERFEAREQIEAALELERSMMNGRPVEGAVELAAWIEESARDLLRQAALGELGSDLGVAADENLIAAGLAEGDAEITVSVEDTPDPADGMADRVADSPEPFEVSRPSPNEIFEMPEDTFGSAEDPPGIPGREAEEMPVDSWTPPAAGADRGLIPSEAAAGPVSDFREEALKQPEAPPADSFQGAQTLNEQEDQDMQDTRIMEPIPAEDEIKITATPWLEEVSEERPGDSLEWPAPSVERDLQHRERIDTPRVRHLFPVPDSDWEVGELEYEHYGSDAS
jgi:hypothetical protein